MKQNWPFAHYLPNQKIRIRRSASSQWLLSCILLGSLAACANFSGIEPSARLHIPTVLQPYEANFAAPSIHQSEAHQASDIKSNSPSSGQALNYWLGFEDAQLQQLLEQALQQNPTMAVAQARIRKAQAALGLLGQGQNINATGALDATRQLFSENAIYPPPIAGSVLTTSSLQASFNWEIDFFGKQQSLLKTGAAQLQAAQADYKVAQLSLSAQVAKAYVTYLKVQLLQQSYHDSLELLQQQENILTQRIQAGIDNQSERVKNQAAQAELQYKLSLLQEQQQALRYVLAALTAQPESSLSIVVNADSFLEKVPALDNVPTHLYLDELANRPDIQAAKWRLTASQSDIRATQAQFYPNINLVGFLGFSSIGWSQLLDAGSTQIGVGPAIRLPLFDGGRLRAYLGGKTADFDIALESYNSILLEAVKEASEPISMMQTLAQQQATQKKLQLHLQQAQEIAQQRFQSGVSNKLLVMSSQSQLQEAKRAQIELQIKSLDNHIQLVKAFGGVRTPVISKS